MLRYRARLVSRFAVYPTITGSMRHRGSPSQARRCRTKSSNAFYRGAILRAMLAFTRVGAGYRQREYVMKLGGHLSIEKPHWVPAADSGSRLPNS